MYVFIVKNEIYSLPFLIDVVKLVILLYLIFVADDLCFIHFYKPMSSLNFVAHVDNGNYLATIISPSTVHVGYGTL